MDCNSFESTSPLISTALEGQIITVLQQITKPVCIVCIADEGAKSREQVIMLRHIVRLNPLLSLKLYARGESIALDQALKAELLPATGFETATGVQRAVFHGVVGGQEMTSFLSALLSVAGASKPLDKYTMKDIAKLNKRVNIEVCVSLACRHCAQTVINAQRVAIESTGICAHMIDANLYPEVVKRYQLERVPVVVMDGDIVAQGALTVTELCKLLAKRK